ncbi:MAG: ribonuclease E/G [Caulobacteraceae bacterium]|nr:ribonuclease E/G [Caulobacteraceae bacterium]
MGRHEVDEELVLARPAPDPQIRAKLDAAIEDALARTTPIPGGGMLTIDAVTALVAIDVDAGARQGSGDPERFALDLNIAAAQEAARQIRLRNLGGIIAIDFVSLKAKSHLKALEDAVRAAFSDDPWSVQFGGLSKFGVFELVRSQLRTPLHEQLRDPDGRLSAGDGRADGVARDRARRPFANRPPNRLHRCARSESLARHGRDRLARAIVQPYRHALEHRCGAQRSILAAR